MTKQELVKRINDKMYEGLYTYDEIKDELDEAIIIINNTLNSKYPEISEVMIEPEDEYKDEEGEEIFPVKYLRTVVVEYVVSALFRREGEFGHEYNVAVGEHNRALSAMFRDLYDKVPEDYIDENTGVIAINPYEVLPDE